MVQTWLWEKEQSHRLFNFHDGYRKYEEKKNGGFTELIGCHIIRKNGFNSLEFLQASEFKQPRGQKLLNIIYSD